MHGYTMRDVQTLLGISRTVVTALIAAGVVAPRRGVRREYRFTFQDVVLLRTAQSLRASRISTRNITRALKRLQTVEQQGRPPTGLRVGAAGRDITVRDRNGQWHVDTGQFVFDFEAQGEGARQGPAPGAVVALRSANARGTTERGTGAGSTSAGRAGETRAGWRQAMVPADDALVHFERGVAAEEHAPEQARAAYAAALAADPDFLDAYLNLGCLLCDRGCVREAIALYRAALKRLPDQPVLHFNLGVALEDAGVTREALRSYHACIDLAPDFADAHYNAARLHEALGDPHRAIRHYNQYRKLEPTS